MRIALVTEYYYPHLGGVTEHVHNLTQQFIRLGHHVTILTSNMAGQDDGALALDIEARSGRRATPAALLESPRGAVVRRVGKSCVVFNNGSFARFTMAVGLEKQVEQILREERIDVVHVHVALVPGLGLAAPEAARRCGIPVVATFHSWFPRQPLYRTFKHVFQQRLDCIAANIAVSEPVVRAMSRYFDTDWDIIPNGVSIGYFHPNGRCPTDALTRGPRLLFLGRLDPRNGLDTVLAAMPHILKRFPKAELTVAGDGPLRPYYARRARKLGSSVRFIGRVYDERPECYSKSDLYVCPTTKASFGITLLEAMASGTPVLASDIIGFRELVNGGREAVLVRVDDPRAWADAAIRLLEDPERRAAMGQAGVVKALGYSWSGIAQRVLRVYERVTR